MSNNYIDPNRNDQFSKLRGVDLQERIAQIQTFLLEYRDSLNLPSDMIFGLGIDYQGRKKEQVKKDFKQKGLDVYILTTILMFNEGIIYTKALTDTNKSWENIQTITEYIQKTHVKQHPNYGCLCQVDSYPLGNNIHAWKRFLKIYTIYEDILFRFGYADKINTSKDFFLHARPFADKLDGELALIEGAKEVQDLSYPLTTQAYENAINFKSLNFNMLQIHGYYNDFEDELRNVINYKTPNNTNNPVILQNFINTYTKLVIAAAKDTLDEELLDYKLETERSSYNYHPYHYNCVNIKKALEFADLIFDNNLDKVYFLRQYFKDFNETNQREILIPSKRFVRTLQPKRPNSP